MYMLSVDGNKLTSIPESISNLPKLEYLDLSDNLLTRIPISLCKLIKNTDITVILDKNQFTSYCGLTILNEQYYYEGEINEPIKKHQIIQYKSFP